MTSKDPNLGQEGQWQAPSVSESGTEKDKLEEIRQQQSRFLALVVVAALMDFVTLTFLVLSAVIAAKYYPSVSEKLAGIWKILGGLVLVLSVAAKLAIVRSGSPILPQRGAENFSSVLRRQGRNADRLIVWFDLRLVIRSLFLSLIAFILAGRPTARRALDFPAAVLLLISAGIIAINLFKARAEMSIADESLLGAVKLQIAQCRYRIRFARNIWYFVAPFLVGFLLLFQSLPNFQGAVPIVASAFSPSLGVVIGLLAFAIAILAVMFVLRFQIRFIRGRQDHASERLRQLEQLLAEISEESKLNRGETLSS